LHLYTFGPAFVAFFVTFLVTFLAAFFAIRHSPFFFYFIEKTSKESRIFFISWRSSTPSLSKII
jgi:hypothetical protein